MKNLKLILYYDCDDCGERHSVEVDLQNDLQTIIEQIEDGIPCPYCGSLTMHTDIVSLSDGFDDYELRF